MNPLVVQYRAAYPQQTKGRTDDELTRFLGDTFRARGDLSYEDAYPDFKEQYLSIKNAGGDIIDETVAAGKAGLLDRLPGTLQGAAALTADALARERLMQQIGLDVPLRAAGDTMRDMAQVNRDEAAQRVSEAGGRTIGRVQDVRGVRDAMLYALPTFAENAPSMLASLGAGAGAALVSGGGAVPGLIAAGASSVAQNAGDLYNDLNADGVNRDKSINAAIMAGIPMGLLDLASEALPLAKLTGAFKGTPNGVIMKRLAEIAGRGGVAGAVKGGVTGVLSEGSTEALQEWVQIAAEEYATGKEATPDQIRDRLINAAAGGAIVGGPVGAITGAMHSEHSPETRVETNEKPTAAPVEQTVVPPVTSPEAPVETNTEVSASPEAAPVEPTSVPVVTAAPVEESAPAPVVEPTPTPEPVTASVPSAPVEPAPAAQPDAIPPPLQVADISPKRIAKTTSNDLAGDGGRGGLYAVAIERGGKVEVRNAYTNKAGDILVENAAELVPNVKLKGTGRNISTLAEAGWTVRQAPFQLAAQQPNLRISTTPVEFDQMIGRAQHTTDTINEAIDNARGDQLIEKALRGTDPAAWKAVEFLQYRIAGDIGASPAQVLTALGTRIDSVAQRDGLRAKTVASKLARNDVLRRKDGKVFGLFTNEQWGDFKTAVHEGEGDQYLTTHFSKPDDFSTEQADGRFRGWADGIAKLGAAEQAGGDAFAGKGKGTLRDPNRSIEGTPGLSDKLAMQTETPDTTAIPLSTDPVSQLYAALEVVGLDQEAVDAALTEMRDYETLTDDDINDIYEFQPELAPARERLGADIEGVKTVIDQLKSLYNETNRDSGSEPAGIRSSEGGVPRAPGSARAEDLRASQPVDSAYRATESTVAGNYQLGLVALREAGLKVDVIEGIESAGSISPSRRHVQLTLGTLTNPTATDMRVMIHEAAHALYSTLAPAFRSAIHRAIDALPASQQPDASTNLSLQIDDPLRLAEERMAVHMEEAGIAPGDAKDLASRLVRFALDVLYRMASAITRAMGFDSTADAFALRYTKNRLNGLLQGDMAPGSLFNAMGGRPLTLAEKASMLPGFGAVLGRVIDGTMQWDDKVPDSFEAVAFNQDLAFSRPVAKTPVGGSNPAAAINRDVATLNHALEVETAVAQTLAASKFALAAGPNRSVMAWFREQFHLEDPAALKSAALMRFDPATQQPVAGTNPNTIFGDLNSLASSTPAKVHAYIMTWTRFKALSGKLTTLRTDLMSEQNRLGRVNKDFIEAHRNYLNAEGLSSIVMKGVRSLIAQERSAGLNVGNQIGVVMQQLREIDNRSATTINKAYSGVFKRLFTGEELRGRNLFNLLDSLVKEANIDFSKSIVDIRRSIAERVGAGMASPELGLLVDESDTSRALLATVVAYGKANGLVIGQIERRRLSNIQERVALQQKLDAVMADRGILNQAVPDLRNTAKFEERMRIYYIQERRRLKVMNDQVTSTQLKIDAITAAVPAYRTAIDDLSRELGIKPDYTFGNGMTYRVPVASANGFTLSPRTLSLDSNRGITDRVQLDRDLASMTEWLGVKESLGEDDGDYRDVKAARDTLLRGGYFESDIRKTDSWISGNLFVAEGAKAAATGLPSGRIVSQMFNVQTATELELKAEGQRLGERNNRLRDTVIDVLNRDMVKKTMTPERYLSEVARPAIDTLEKAKDLLELGLPISQALNQGYQRVFSQLSANPEIEPFLRGKAGPFIAALKAHVEGVEAASKFFNDTNTKHGLGVRDERLFTVRGDGIETAGIRDAVPVGLVTVSSGTSGVAANIYNIMKGLRWGTMKDTISGIKDLYTQQGPAAVQAALAPYFNPAILRDFVGAMTANDTFSVFDAPVLADGITRPQADPTLTAQAWNAAKGDVVTFVEMMYAIHNGTSDRAQYMADMLGRMDEYFGHLGERLDQSTSGIKPDGLSRLTSNRMIDARTVERWPSAWREYLFFDPQTNHEVSRQIAAQVAFGRDTQNLNNVWTTMEGEMKEAVSAHDQIIERETNMGYAGKELAKRVEADYVARLAAAGKGEYARLERLKKLQPIIAESRENLRAFFGGRHAQADSTRFVAALGQFITFGMLNNPGTALMNLADLFAPVAQGGVSGATLKQVARNWKNLGEGVAGSLAQSVGLDILKSSRLQNKYVGLGFNDPAVMLNYINRTEDGVRSDLIAGRNAYEKTATRALRIFTKTLSVGITPLGEKSRFTALRPLAPFSQFVHETMRASTISTWQRVEDMVGQGLDYFATNRQAQTDPNFKLTGDILGLKGAELATFDTLRRRLSEGYGLELTALTREALRRQAGPKNQNALLSDASRAVIQGMVANELILEGNLSTMTSKAWTSGAARLMLPLLGWPIRRALQVARTGLDSDDKFRMHVLGRGIAALGVMAGAGLAMSLLADEYHEEILGRKRNLRSVGSLPGQLQRGQFKDAFLNLMENVNRAGTFGMWGEVLNTGLNGVAGGGDNRTLSLDSRVVMMNSMLSLGRSISTFAAQHEIDYSGVVRPAISALGGNSFLQYTQLGNRALGLDNVEARFVERVDAQNRLRVIGRELGLEVRTGAGGGAAPTSLTPIISRMVLAAYAGDRRDFINNWREAVKEAREQGKEDPVSYVRDSFAGRNPLKTVFRTLSEDDYARIIRGLDGRGRAEVKSAVNQFNTYAQSLDARAYTGTARSKIRVAR